MTASAWLDDKLRTLDGKSIGRRLFLVGEEERPKRAVEALDTMRAYLDEALEVGDEVLEEAASDCVFLGIHAYAAQAGTWLGADAWPLSIMTKASPPAFAERDAERVLLRGASCQAVSPEEVRAVVGAFVEATWGDSSHQAAAATHGFSGVMISAPPQFAALQYTIGVLWGYALRGLVLRLALDRALGTMPESAAKARQRLERSMVATDEDENVTNSDQEEDTGSEQASPTLLRYAAEFFGHSDWAALCKPTDAAVAVLEGELEEALPGIALLAGAEDNEEELAVRNIVGLEEEGDEDEDYPMEDMVMLSQEEWEGFQRRSIAMGSLLADSEALVDTQVGPLRRGGRPASRWIQSLVRGGALSGVRREHGTMLARRILTPVDRLMEVLRTDFLASKLRTARQGLERLYGQEGANASSPREPGEEEEA